MGAGQNEILNEILLIEGGLGAERKISFSTGASFSKALDELGYTYKTIEADKDLIFKLKEIEPIENKIALIALHGKYGEDGIVQSLCEYLKLPYTGSGVLSSSLSMDKVLTKDVFKAHGIPNPPGYSLNVKQEGFPKASLMDFPLIVKPSREGSSFGVTLVKKESEWMLALKEASLYDHILLVEKYIEGMEYTLPFLIDRILPSVEILPKKGFYDYGNKYTPGHTDYYIPARISKEFEERCRKYAMKVVQVFRVRGYARIDFRLDLKNEVPYVIELNTLPGFTPTSLLPQSAASEGFKYSEILDQIIKAASLDYDD